MEDAFDRYERDFYVTKCHLIRNYRSAPELVRIQHYIAQAIESKTPEAEPVKKGDGEAICTVLEFSSSDDEAKYIANMISNDIQTKGLKPRSFCILARQKTGFIIKKLQTELEAHSIKLRDESTLQDLLAEPFTELVLALLRLAVRERDPEAWEFIIEELNRLHGFDPSISNARISAEATRLLNWTKAAISDPQLNRVELPEELSLQIGESAIRSCYRQYGTGTYLNDVAVKIGNVLNTNPNQKMETVVTDLIGEDIVPAMTVHKSKGLEFHTVVFLGLEDSQLWNFARQSEEEIRGFFVAFSRAIHRVIFTYSDKRDGKYGRPERQSQRKIKDLYSLLQKAGVKTINCRDDSD
jgi:superfamily I DNA/RNA helicase